MEIRYISQADSLLEISNIYECSWKYAYKDIIPQEYLDSIPTGQWADNISKAGRNNLICIEKGKIVGIEELKQSGFKKVLLWVLEDNHRARKFYEKNGFFYTGAIMEDNIGGRDIKEVSMCLE